MFARVSTYRADADKLLEGFQALLLFPWVR